MGQSLVPHAGRLLLVAALLAPVLLPAAQLQRQEPENPIREENIQPVNVLSFGETDGGTRASAPLTFTQDTNAEGGQTEQDNEQPPEEETDDTPPELPTETIPQPEPVNDPTHTDTQPGENAEDVPGDAGEQTEPAQEPDLGLVLNWYRYGSERVRSLCPSDETVRQPVRAAQLPDGYLRYELDLRGLDAADSEITDVTLSKTAARSHPPVFATAFSWKPAAAARTAPIRCAQRLSAPARRRTEAVRSRRLRFALC